jgi:hypothetical protein
MEPKQVRYIITVDTDENGERTFGKAIREDKYIRRKKLNQLKKLYECRYR